MEVKRFKSRFVTIVVYVTYDTEIIDIILFVV